VSNSVSLLSLKFDVCKCYLVVPCGDIQLDFTQQLDDQGPIDVILHKLTDHMNRSLGHGQEAVKWMSMIQVCFC